MIANIKLRILMCRIAWRLACAMRWREGKPPPHPIFAVIPMLKLFFAELKDENVS